MVLPQLNCITFASIDAKNVLGVDIFSSLHSLSLSFALSFTLSPRKCYTNVHITLMIIINAIDTQKVLLLLEIYSIK
jgi:hypothetical protein